MTRVVTRLWQPCHQIVNEICHLPFSAALWWPRLVTSPAAQPLPPLSAPRAPQRPAPAVPVTTGPAPAYRPSSPPLYACRPTSLSSIWNCWIFGYWHTTCVLNVQRRSRTHAKEGTDCSISLRGEGPLELPDNILLVEAQSSSVLYNKQ